MDGQKIFSDLSKIEWSSDLYTMSNLIESLEMPQLVRISRSMQDGLKQNDYLLLQSVYDRYLLLGQKENESNTWFVIPDWYTPKCKILSTHPKIQKQYWNFQGASEINRFELPRDINFLIESPLYQFVRKSGDKVEWRKVCLKRNTRLTAIRLHKYSINNADQGPCFILVDRTGLQYMLPADFNIKFSVEIRPEEYNESYFDHQGTFTLPEIITRYELPVSVELKQNEEVNNIPQSKLPQGPIKIHSVAIAKSIIGVFLNAQQKQHHFVELSPATPIDMSIPKCLQKGLKNPNTTLTHREEEEYALYNSTREVILNAYHKNCELYKYDLRQASNDEKSAMIKIYDEGKQYRQTQLSLSGQQALLNLNSKEASNPDAKIPFINLKNVFLRPNIDEGDPYDDVNHDQDNEDSANAATHDLSAFNDMPDRLVTDLASDMENLRLK